jgi:hypothetical protein
VLSSYLVKFVNEPYWPIGLLANFVIIGFLGMLMILLLLRVFYYLYFKVSCRNTKFYSSYLLILTFLNLE